MANSTEVMPTIDMLPGAVAEEAAYAGVVQPTKLFIGGISRRTTTKQLRDHFSKCGRVLDCVAMRTPDGRPRGFGYVTLDSPAAAERFLREPQMIDDRIVDMKRAVPESQAAKASTPVGLCGGPCLLGSGYGMGAEVFHHPGMFYGMWPEEAAGAYCDPGYYGMGMLPPTPDMGSLQQQAGIDPSMPDCVDLLTGPQMEYQMGYQMVSPLSTTPMGFAGKGPLSEVTNVVDRRNSPTSAAAAGKTTPASPTSLTFPPGELTKPYQPALLDTQVSPISGEMEPCFVYEDAQEQDAALSIVEGAAVLEGDRDGPLLSEEETSSQEDGEDVEMPVWNEGDPLPSLGSAQHASGECRRCNFFAKGRCRNGQDCTFCHLPHERRKLSRQEKREQQAARQSQQEDKPEEALKTGPLLSPVLPPSAILRPGLVPPQLSSLEPVAPAEPSPEPLLTSSSGSASARSAADSLPPGLRPPGLPPPPAGAATPVFTPASSCGSAPLFATTPSAPGWPPLFSTMPSPAGSSAPQATPREFFPAKVVKETATVATQTDADLGCKYCQDCGEFENLKMTASDCICGDDDKDLELLDADDKAKAAQRTRRRRTAATALAEVARAKAAAAGGS